MAGDDEAQSANERTLLLAKHYKRGLRDGAVQALRDAALDAKAHTGQPWGQPSDRPDMLRASDVADVRRAMAANIIEGPVPKPVPPLRCPACGGQVRAWPSSIECLACPAAWDLEGKVTREHW